MEVKDDNQNIIIQGIVPFEHLFMNKGKFQDFAVTNYSSDERNIVLMSVIEKPGTKKVGLDMKLRVTPDN